MMLYTVSQGRGYMDMQGKGWMNSQRQFGARMLVTSLAMAVSLMIQVMMLAETIATVAVVLGACVPAQDVVRRLPASVTWQQHTAKSLLAALVLAEVVRLVQLRRGSCVVRYCCNW